MIEYRDIPSFGGRYQAGSDGSIKSLCGNTPRLLALFKSNAGYLRVCIFTEGKAKSMSVHRLVMEAFHGPSSLHVDHINSDKLDNRVSNLRYVTASENQRAIIARGRRNTDYCRGERSACAKLTEVQVREIWALRHSGKSTSQVGALYAVSRQLIYHIWARRVWAHLNLS